MVASYNKEMHEIDNSKKLSMNNSLNEVFEVLSLGVNYTGIEPMNRQAAKTVSGKLDGGNLTLVQSLFSTVYEGSYSDKIMMLEDTGVTPKHIAHRFYNNIMPDTIWFNRLNLKVRKDIAFIAVNCNLYIEERTLQ